MRGSGRENEKNEIDSAREFRGCGRRLQPAVELCGATLLAFLSAVVIGRHNPNGISSARQTFEVTGAIRSLEAGVKTVRIEHEEIPRQVPAAEREH